VRKRTGRVVVVLSFNCCNSNSPQEVAGIVNSITRMTNKKENLLRLFLSILECMLEFVSELPSELCVML
jgi:hypothetical protein